MILGLLIIVIACGALGLAVRYHKQIEGWLQDLPYILLDFVWALVCRFKEMNMSEFANLLGNTFKVITAIIWLALIVILFLGVLNAI